MLSLLRCNRHISRPLAARSLDHDLETIPSSARRLGLLPPSVPGEVPQAPTIIAWGPPENWPGSASHSSDLCEIRPTGTFRCYGTKFRVPARPNPSSVRPIPAKCWATPPPGLRARSADPPDRPKIEVPQRLAPKRIQIRSWHNDLSGLTKLTGKVDPSQAGITRHINDRKGTERSPATTSTTHRMCARAAFFPATPPNCPTQRSLLGRGRARAAQTPRGGGGGGQLYARSAASPGRPPPWTMMMNKLYKD